MDLQDFEGQLLYFDLDTPIEVTELIQAAAEHYADGTAEDYLSRAYEISPANLTVLVALYRFYYYQHRYAEALSIAYKAMSVVAPAISFPEHWSEVTFNDLANGVMTSFTMVRFYLLALKGAAYLSFRMGECEAGVRMLNKVIELDANDRLGAKVLLQSIRPSIESMAPTAITV